MEMINKKRKLQIRNINSVLPSAIIELILTKLPFVTLPSCRIVCKAWNDQISTCKFDPKISNSSLFLTHFCRKIYCVDCDRNPGKLSLIASFNFHPISGGSFFSILNSCNGLLCLFNRRNIYILNPMTNEYFKLQISKFDSRRNYHYGLGLSHETKQFKIVRGLVSYDSSVTLIEIRAFGASSGWMTVGFLPFICGSTFVYFNGGIFFVKIDQDGSMDEDGVIYRLDVENEKLSKISRPEGSVWCLHIVDLNGILYLTTTHIHDHLYHVWEMREDFSWIKVFVLADTDYRSRFFRLIKVCEDGKILYIDESDFILYDPKFKTKIILIDQYYAEGIEFHYLSVLLKFDFQISNFNFNSLPKILFRNG